MRDKKADGLHRKAASIDGIVSSGPRLGAPVHRSYQPTRGHHTPTLDTGSHRLDGFHPSRPTSGSLGATAAEVQEHDALIDEPIVLDDMDYHKGKDKVHGRIKRARLRKFFKRLFLSVLLVLL